MAYGNPVDPTTPTDADLATGDDEFRQLKAALIERVESYFNDIDEDPWTVRDDRHRREITFGLLANRPNPPAETGLIYFATDTIELFLSTPEDPDPVWTEIPLGATLARGLQNELPAEPATDFWWSTDTDALYIREGAEWTQVNPDAADPSSMVRIADYYPNNASGVRILNLVGARVTYLHIRDYTIPGGDQDSLDIPWTELVDLGIPIEAVRGFICGAYSVFGAVLSATWLISAKLVNTIGAELEDPPYDSIRVRIEEVTATDVTSDATISFTIGIIYDPAIEEPEP